jgi:MFS family permease
MLHLQRGFGLDVLGVAAVFLPGAIAMSVLPEHLHGLVARFGRRRMLTLGSLASALCAGGLAFAPSPPWIAAFWILSAAAWSVIIPVQQSVIAEAAGASHLGRGLSLYEAAALAGAFVGSLTAGLLYESGRWLTACLLCAGVIAAGALIVPRAVGRLGVTDRPEPSQRMTTPEKPAHPESTVDEECAAGSEPDDSGAPRRSRLAELRGLGWHTALLVLALAAAWLLVPEFSVEAALGIGPDSGNSLEGLKAAVSGGSSLTEKAQGVFRVWVLVYAVDVIWTAWGLVDRGGGARGSRS